MSIDPTKAAVWALALLFSAAVWTAVILAILGVIR